MESITQRLLTKGFGQPTGLFGRLGGRLMAHGNAATERHVVALAAPTDQEVVLVVGPGPGVGLDAAARRSAHVIGVDPSDVMLAMARRRCAPAIARGRLRLGAGTAARTGEPDHSVDVVLSVNNLQLWPDVPAGLAELHRILRPGGRMLLAAHEKWLPTALPALAHTVLAAGFTSVRTWTWQPPTRMASTTALLSATLAHRPADGPPTDEPAEVSEND
ncbi:class I SAM-dependent methyltransferase [Streptomyces sp. MB09-01]|uniref:class I SAM-dependent methyltransferase n=1 Tax=Streptomyces sp. MB09-01 TaxID=3028666 RepID=UPI0029A0960A|nr:class I SAM-dependent methyltransferase [Streptomyces sp. MB09-01]MDX3533066.1 class I SAM-dependent methyltransferase [Streptomyces sp. MB09-01]